MVANTKFRPCRHLRTSPRPCKHKIKEHIRSPVRTSFLCTKGGMAKWRRKISEQAIEGLADDSGVRSGSTKRRQTNVYRCIHIQFKAVQPTWLVPRYLRKSSYIGILIILTGSMPAPTIEEQKGPLRLFKKNSGKAFFFLIAGVVVMKPNEWRTMAGWNTHRQCSGAPRSVEYFLLYSCWPSEQVSAIVSGRVVTEHELTTKLLHCSILHNAICVCVILTNSWHHCRRLDVRLIANREHAFQRADE